MAGFSGMSAFAGALATLLVGIIGFGITYWNNLRLERKKSEIKLVSDQLEKLYGPLFSLTKASGAAWGSFRSRFRPNSDIFSEIDPPNAEELREWRLWMNEVFMPLNLKIENAIVSNSHLIEGPEMPKPFLDFLAHVEVWKAVFTKWTAAKIEEHRSHIRYPSEFKVYVYDTFARLKAKQNKLIGIQSDGVSLVASSANSAMAATKAISRFASIAIRKGFFLTTRHNKPAVLVQKRPQNIE